MVTLITSDDLIKESYLKETVYFFETALKSRPEKLDAIKRYLCDIYEELFDVQFKRCAWRDMSEYSKRAISICDTSYFKALDAIVLALSSSNIDEFLTKYNIKDSDVQLAITKNVNLLIKKDCLSELEKSKINMLAKSVLSAESAPD